MSEQIVVEFEDVSFSYSGEPVLENVSLSIPDHEFVWIVGPNGGGKTTLVKLMIGLLEPERGRISVMGQDVATARSRIGYMPQQTNLDLKFPITAMDAALMGRLGNGSSSFRFSHEDRRAAADALGAVGLSDQTDRPIGELSGGQQRRLLIARALACEPELLILDEPTANLDRVIEKELFDLLRTLSGKMTVVMVSHDPAFVSDFVRNVVCVNRTVSVHPTSALDSEFMHDLYRGKMRIVRHDRHEEHSSGHPHEH